MLNTLGTAPAKPPGRGEEEDEDKDGEEEEEAPAVGFPNPIVVTPAAPLLTAPLLPLFCSCCISSLRASTHSCMSII